MEPTNPAPTDQLPSAFKLFTPSWEAVKLNLATLVLLYILPIFAIIAAFGIGELLYNASHPLGIVIGIVLGVAALGLVVVSWPGRTYAQLQSTQGNKVSLQQALTVGRNFALRSLLLSICTGLLIIGGFLLLVIPGVILLRRYYLAQYVLLDQNLKIGQAMRASGTISKPKPAAKAIWGIIGVTILIQLFQFIPFVGWIITLVLTAMYYCAGALRYLQLKSRAAQAPTPPPPAT